MASLHPQSRLEACLVLANRTVTIDYRRGNSSSSSALLYTPGKPKSLASSAGCYDLQYFSQRCEMSSTLFSRTFLIAWQSLISVRLATPAGAANFDSERGLNARLTASPLQCSAASHSHLRLICAACGSSQSNNRAFHVLSSETFCRQYFHRNSNRLHSLNRRKLFRLTQPRICGYYHSTCFCLLYHYSLA